MLLIRYYSITALYYIICISIIHRVYFIMYTIRTHSILLNITHIYALYTYTGIQYPTIKGCIESALTTVTSDNNDLNSYKDAHGPIRNAVRSAGKKFKEIKVELIPSRENKVIQRMAFERLFQSDNGRRELNRMKQQGQQPQQSYTQQQQSQPTGNNSQHQSQQAQSQSQYNRQGPMTIQNMM